MKEFLRPVHRNIIYAALAVGIGGAVYGLLQSDRFWPSLLQNSFFFLTVALGAAVFVAVNHVSNAAWTSVLRRVPEAMMTYVPIGGLVLLMVFFGKDALYEWTGTTYSHHGHELVFKNMYLTTGFFFARMVAFLLIWTGLIFLIRRESFSQDESGSLKHTARSKVYSALFLVVFGVTFTFASIDWIMSIEPMFFSTIYGFYNIAGVLLSGTASITILVILLKRAGYLTKVGDRQLHSLGKLVLGFATFWAYIWISQYLLIYYAAIPEETIHYVRRTSGDGWWNVFLLALLLNWVIPFLMLLQKKVKFYENWMLAACGIVLVGHWVDLYVLIFPAFYSSPMIGVVDITLPFGFLALFVLVFLRALGRKRLLPEKDPYIAESAWQEPA